MEKQKSQALEHRNPETPQRFFKLLEAGDLAFLDFMQYAIVVFGITKHGKTTYSHHLAGHSLQAYLNQDNSVHYRLKTQTDRRSDARIGAKMHSQTQIPNKLESGLFEGSTPVYLIDNPGQKDSFGINRVLSNAYFHYRIFTKIQKMKIILLFDYPTFSRNITETNEILNLFLNCFTNFSKVKDQLLNSIAIVFTKVQRQVSMQDVIQRIVKGYLSGIKDKDYFEPEKEQFVKKLFNLCIQSDNRIKIFRKAEIGVTIEINRNLIGEISSSLQYFSRDLVQNDEFQSKHYQQKKAQMKSIRFSESNKVMSLSNKQGQKINTLKLFNQLTQRGENLFSSLFQTLTKLFNYVLFNNEANQLSSKHKLNQTQIILQKRRKAQRQILQTLAEVQIQYDNTQKYVKRRQQILQRYGKCFKSTLKAENFIQRMVLITSFRDFCLKYEDREWLRERNQNSLNRFRKDFEEVIEKASKFYSGKQEIEILSKFQYNLNTLLNQMIIFCMIILPNAENEQIKDINSKTRGYVDPYLGKFLDCIGSLSKHATKMNDILASELAKEFNLRRSSVTKLQQNLIMDHYLRKFPTIIVDQRDQQESILRSLTNIELSLQHKIHCQILIFKYLQKKFYFLTELNSFDQEDKQKIDLMASSPQDKKGRRQKKQQAPKEISKQNILCLIKSLVIYLKSVKKMKELSQYNQFKTYKVQIFQINYLVWTYLVKLFCLLLETKEVSEQQRQDSKEILIEIVSTSNNYNLMEQVFEKLLEKHQEAFKQLTVKTSLRNLSKQTQKRVKLQSSDNLKYFLTSKKTLSQEIINLTLTYAQLLNDLGLKDKALTQCYSIMKYEQFSPSEVFKIEEMVRKIKSKNTGFRIEDKLRSVTEFEATITIKKQLGRFLKDNSDVKQLQCVNFQFLN